MKLILSIKRLSKSISRIVSCKIPLVIWQDKKNIIPSDIPETYTIKAMFHHISREDKLRTGILAFRDFLYLIWDRLIAEGSIYDKPVKNAQNNATYSGLPVKDSAKKDVTDLAFL